jgi:hypothetical protein
VNKRRITAFFLIIRNSPPWEGARGWGDRLIRNSSSAVFKKIRVKFVDNGKVFDYNNIYKHFYRRIVIYTSIFIDNNVRKYFYRHIVIYANIFI